MTTATEPEKATPDSRGLALFLLSMAVLAQELLLVRLLAVPLWNHITYMVVTSALLAFGVAGTLLAVFPALGGKTPRGAGTAFAIYALLFGLTTFVTAQAIGNASIDTIDLLKKPGLLVDLFLLYLVVGLPLLFAGLAVTTALKHAGPALPRLYFVNLVGSGAGCVVFLLAIEPLTGPGLLLLTAALAGAAAAAVPRRPALRVAGFALVLTTAVAGFVPGLRSVAVPEPEAVASKDVRNYLAKGHKIERTIWNSLCRIDVSDIPGERTTDEEKRRAKMIFQDGDAPTFLYPPGAAPSMETMVPYIMHPGASSIMVIGAGGGRELSLASSKGLKRILGVEINSATVSLLREHYRAFTGDIVGQPGVELVNAEARSWLARNPEKFDFIQMTGVDTYAALNSGAYVASESYLYTQDAFDAYLAHLNDGGFFSIIRLFFENSERETLRLFVMGLDALRRKGISNPEKHLLVVKSGLWGILVVGREPLPEPRVAEVRGQIAAALASIPETRVALQYDPFNELPTPFSAYIKSVRANTENEFFDGYPFNVRPVDDDSPFFYLYHHWSVVVKRLLGIGGGRSLAKESGPVAGNDANSWLANTGQVPTGQYVLLGLLAQAVIVGVLLVLGPLVAFRRRALTIPGTFRSVLCFASLGLGFMLLEISLAQKFALFLGHPTLSLAVVIAGMLFFSGLGSLVSGMLPPRGAARGAAVAVALLATAMAIVLPKITATWLEATEPVRIALALAVLAPIAFTMGMPMPSNLRLLGARGADLIPWAWGVNGVASVVGSILAIILAMEIGFTGVLAIAAGLYLVAGLCRVREADA